MKSDRQRRGPLGLTRDPEQGFIAGVCAGIALRLGVNPWAVRILTILFALFFSVAAVLAYLLAAVFLPRRTLEWHGRRSEREFWRSAGRDHGIEFGRQHEA